MNNICNNIFFMKQRIWSHDIINKVYKNIGFLHHLTSLYAYSNSYVN